MLRTDFIEGKGRGVFSTKEFKRGEIIERSPVIVIPYDELEYLRKTVLRRYWFKWIRGKAGVIALGYGSLFNHSYHPNAAFHKRIDELCIEFQALEDIQFGEEITINYNRHPYDQSPVGFDVVE